MISYCSVKDCRYNTTHNKEGHRCHKCSKYGHGIYECGNFELIDKLTFFQIPEKDKCQISGCQHTNNHTSAGHKCRTCKQYNHGWKQCKTFINCELCGTKGHSKDTCVFTSPDKIAGNTPGKIYVLVYEEMGSCSYHKRDSPSDTFKTYYMHQDAWGQYGFSNVPNLKEFLNGYSPLREIDKVDKL
jgi:hypothetical protein